ncbi:nucleotidyltransferase family protein [Paucibacter sp. APW11]|uniref:Nucleotidyltransferase family protein n=1 Tax=Roseateles aquae TaxID=3077235 RepID=A0ABU3PBM1_9BURK|nr:nucleotidyltransferase family protein [Paucibacter sp. APW11]MDT8999533.1 nucleotidyltransferase family protein [Paucibacter sp. APW11]
MRAIILAAGRGERLRPLTDHTPKPLIEVGGKPLIVWHIEALAAAGVRDIVINTAWLGEQFPALLGDGSRWAVRLHYSHEQRDHGQALETAGGIATALPLLCADGDEAFWAVSGDIHAPDFRYDSAQAQAFVEGGRLAHLWMVPTQPAHPLGDFSIDGAGRAGATGEPRHVYGNIGLYRRAFFDQVRAGQRMPMRPCLDAAIAHAEVTAELYPGRWVNVGNAELLAQARALHGAVTGRD